MKLVRRVDEPRLRRIDLDRFSFRTADLVLDALQVPPVVDRVFVDPLDRKVNLPRRRAFHVTNIDLVSVIPKDLVVSNGRHYLPVPLRVVRKDTVFERLPWLG